MYINCNGHLHIRKWHLCQHQCSVQFLSFLPKCLVTWGCCLLSASNQIVRRQQELLRASFHLCCLSSKLCWNQGWFGSSIVACCSAPACRDTAAQVACTLGDHCSTLLLEDTLPHFSHPSLLRSLSLPCRLRDHPGGPWYLVQVQNFHWWFPPIHEKGSCHYHCPGYKATPPPSPNQEKDTRHTKEQHPPFHQ